MNRRVVVLVLSEDDAEELAEAVASKRNFVGDGMYGAPADETERWESDLQRLEQAIRDAPVVEVTL